MIDYLSQGWITVFGATAILLINGPTRRHRRGGVVCGLLSQPAWYIQLIIHGQWLMLPVYTIYTLSWLYGLRNNWLRPDPSLDTPKETQMELKHETPPIMWRL